MIRVRLKFLTCALAALTFPATVWATNGYFSHGTSIAEKGMAGAGVAFSQDTLAAANNPAGMVWQGARYDIGAALFAPMREYKATGAPSAPPGTPCGLNCPFSIGDGNQNQHSENEAFLIPQFGYNWVINDDSTIGVSVFGNGGMNTEYAGGTAILGTPSGTNAELPGTFGDHRAGVDLAQLFLATTYSRKITETSSWGVSGLVAYQRFKATGVANFAPFSSDPSNLSDNGYDHSTGFGVRVGVQAEIMSGVRVGAAYQPKIDMDEFDDYSGLFAEDGDFDIPSNFTVGLAVDIGKTGVLVIDVQQINYEDVDSVSNSISPLTDGSCIPPTGSGDGCLGGDDGAGFGWEDMTVVKVGFQWQTGTKNTWRLGYSTGDQPIPDDESLFNILAPGVVEEHFTAGYTRQLDDKSSINFSAMYAPNESVKGASPFDPAQDIEIEMDQYELAVSYSRNIL